MRFPLCVLHVPHMPGTAQEVLGIPKGKVVNLVPSGYPGLAYLPHMPGVVVTLGFRDPSAYPSHLLGCERPSVLLRACTR